MGNLVLSGGGLMPQKTKIHAIKKKSVDSVVVCENGSIIFSLCDEKEKFILDKKLFYLLLEKYKRVHDTQA